jgi:hypothetical protein
MKPKGVLRADLEVADYAELRLYAGAATTLFVTASGIAGTFVRDATVTVDNGGTEIVGVFGWKRVYLGALDIRWFGGVADYAGTPLYDGADAGRITATDNTDAFLRLVNAAISSGKESVRLAAGHWAIKTGNLSFSNFGKLRIFGDGIGVTILDFIKEDTTHTGGVIVTPAQANAIASFSTGTELEFQDMTVKATTKGGVVNGVAGSNRVYEGAVWGFKITGVTTVRLTRVRAERFNYRGFSITAPGADRVLMTHCEGFYNAGSGFWVEGAAVFRVIGGEFAYNGVFGETGTGYGVTASNTVGKFIVDGVYCHHNYRKGIDSHGCAMMKVSDSTFENNVLYHIANPNWQPPTGTADGTVIIKGNTFSNGKLPADKAWLKTCYDQLATNGYTANADAGGVVFAVFDTNASSVNTSTIATVVIEDNKVVCHYNGIGDTTLTKNAHFLQVIAQVARITFRNNNINFENAGMPASGDVYSHIAMRLYGETTIVAGNNIKFTLATQYTNTTSASSDFGALLELKPNTLKAEFYGNQFTLNDCYFTSSTAAGVRSPVLWTVAGSRRVAKDNVWTYTSDPYKGANSLNDAYFLGAANTTAPLQQSGNLFVRGGVRYRVQEGTLDRTFCSEGYRLTGVSKLAGADVFYIVLDKQYSTTVRVKTDDGSPDLVIKVPFSTYVGVSGTAGNSLFEYSSVDAAFAEDGLTKLKITVKAKVNLSGSYWGRVEVDGTNPSFGVEKVVQL